MSEQQQETGGADALTPEEQSFFESGGETEIQQESDDVQQAEGQAETKAETEEVTAEKAEETQEGSNRTVPHQALHAEREEHKKTRAEMQELREFKAKIEERFRLADQLAAQQQQESQEDPDPEPDPNVDVFAHNAWLSRQMKAQREAAANEANERAKANEASEFEGKVWTYWRQDAQSYGAQNPDFQNAAKWLAEFRDKQLEAYGALDPRFTDPATRSAQIDAELKEIVVAAARQQKSPAQIVYDMAKGYGYSPEQAAAAAQGATKGNVSEKLEKLEQAQNGSRTVGQASGQGGGDEMTAEALMALPEHEFTAWMSKPGNERKFRSMMGG